MKRDSDETDDRPRKRRKKKPEKSTNWTPYLIIAGAGSALMTLIIVVVVIVIIVRTPGGEPLEPVTDYVGYDTPENVFHVDLPKGWMQENGGKMNSYYVVATRGSAEIHVNQNLVGSLIGDIAGAADRGRELSDEELPVSKVHEFKKQVYEEDYGKYQEEPAVTIRTGFGKTRRSNFTGRKGLMKVKGVRATTLGSLTQITVTCTCAESDWSICEPAFTRAIESLSVGRGGR